MSFIYTYIKSILNHITKTLQKIANVKLLKKKTREKNRICPSTVRDYFPFFFVADLQ